VDCTPERAAGVVEVSEENIVAGELASIAVKDLASIVQGCIDKL
jgi:hypothetical protein